MIALPRFASLSIHPKQRQMFVFLALICLVAWIDGTRPLGRDWSNLYFLPLCYASWYLRGRRAYLLFSILGLCVFLAPPLFDPGYFVYKSRAFNRFTGVVIGFVLFEVLRRVRKLTDQLEASNQHLETRVTARTLELQRANEALRAEIAERRQAQLQQLETHRQLLQSQKLEVVGQFAGGIAHDFNNMLTVILGYTTLLLEPLNSEDAQKKSLLAIKNASERAADLTRQLLVFSRHNVVQLKVVQLNELIVDAEKMLRPLIPESIDLRVELCPDLPFVVIDPAQFSQVLINLAVNARDAMPTGGQLTIRTGLLRSEPSVVPLNDGLPRHEQVLLEVSDTGCGMAPEVRERIFEPFFTTKSVGKGVGLGLSIVDGIVRQSQGRIDVRTTPNQGTCFRILLPPTFTPSIATFTDNLTRSDGRGETILLVEDEDPLRQLAAFVLQDAGYRVVDAGNGAEACAKAARLAGGIDLLLTDVVMPGMSGRQLSDRLQSLHPRMKVIYMSGYNNDAIVAFGVVHETVHFLAKPFSPDELKQKVRSVLQCACPEAGERDFASGENSAQAA